MEVCDIVPIQVDDDFEKVDRFQPVSKFTRVERFSGVSRIGSAPSCPVLLAEDGSALRLEDMYYITL